MFLSLVAATLAATVSVSGNDVLVDGVRVTAYAAAPLDAVVQGGVLYVLTSDGTVEVRPIGADGQAGAPTARMAAPGAVALVLLKDAVSVAVAETRVVPLAALAVPVSVPTEPPAPTAPAPTASGRTSANATVVRTDVGTAVIDAGRDIGLAVGDDVRILGTRTVRTPSLSGTGTEERAVERVVATGRVRVIEKDRALVDLARGGTAAAGDRVEPKADTYRYPVAPERFENLREIGGVLRPLLALDTVGVAMVNEAWFTVGFEKPWYAQARLSPIGVGWSRDGNPFTVAVLGSGGYDSRYFSVGLGAGWSLLNSDPGVPDYATDASGQPLTFEDVDSAFAFVQEARLGARDGLHLGLRNTLLLAPTYEVSYTYDDVGNTDVVVDDKGRAFVFGGIAMDIAIPTGDRTDLFVDWGTGQAGAVWVEGGVSSWLRGNGDPGSIGVRVGAGYASVTGNPSDDRVSLYGPMVSVGGRYRF